MCSSSSQTALYIVVPCYNEQEVLPLTIPTLLKEIEVLASANLCDPTTSKLLLVDDGSTDCTWKIIETYSSKSSTVRGVQLSRNRGHQNALLCGLAEAYNAGCDCAISIDADGQDDEHAMEGMLRAYAEGSDVVYGVRIDRSTDTPLKRATAQAFYKTMSALGAETVYNHADYRLLSRRALEALLELKEVNLYLRGMVPLVGFASSIVGYSRKEREAGQSHYPIHKMISLAIEGVTSMSARPLRLVTVTGATGFAAGAAACALTILRGKRLTNPLLIMLSGAQILATGIVGEYVGKAYAETKQRPRWVVAKRTWT